jgi:hypothetical protein
MVKRFGYKTPKLDPKMRRRFRRFVELWLRHNMVSLTDVDVPTFEEWLEATPYSAARKAELKSVWDKRGRVYCKKRFRRVKSFIKDETYEEWKYPRLINSRVDEAKCYFGPVVQAVSDSLFSRHEFIKTIPVPDRPKYIRDLLMSSGVDSDYIFTDYTAFEAHFVPEVMQITQFLLFRYMLKGTSRGEWLKNYEETMAGTNVLQFKAFTAMIEGTRMSGEMDTSLSNGFANLMLFLFLVSENGGRAVGVVEGDDGLFRVSPSSAAPTKDQFAQLGFTIKIGTTKELSEASFCGQVYDMTDLVVVANPLEIIARLGWTSKRYVGSKMTTRLQLLRARGYSLVYQYSGCPLLESLGRRILFLTEGIVISRKVFSNLDAWERAKLFAATSMKLPVYKEPGERTRHLVHKLYGISLDEQLVLEEHFAALELGRYDMPCLDRLPECWKDYFSDYSNTWKTNDPAWLLKPEARLLGDSPVHRNGGGEAQCENTDHERQAVEHHFLLHRFG